MFAARAVNIVQRRRLFLCRGERGRSRHPLWFSQLELLCPSMAIERRHALVNILVENDIDRGVHLAEMPPVAEWAGAGTLAAAEVNLLEELRSNVSMVCVSLALSSFVKCCAEVRHDSQNKRLCKQVVFLRCPFAGSCVLWEAAPSLSGQVWWRVVQAVSVLCSLQAPLVEVLGRLLCAWQRVFSRHQAKQFGDTSSSGAVCTEGSQPVQNCVRLVRPSLQAKSKCKWCCNLRLA